MAGENRNDYYNPLNNSNHQQQRIQLHYLQQIKSGRDKSICRSKAQEMESVHYQQSSMFYQPQISSLPLFNGSYAYSTILYDQIPFGPYSLKSDAFPGLLIFIIIHLFY